MSTLGNPRSMRLIGLSLLLGGALAFLGLRTLFLDHWIAVFMFGATGWFTAAVYGLIGIILAGAALVLASFLVKRRTAS